jgi:hypothetical protein
MFSPFETVTEPKADGHSRQVGLGILRNWTFDPSDVALIHNNHVVPMDHLIIGF